MKPDLALTLSFEGISLLRRVPGGWAHVGDVALDAADLRRALADLRTEADTLASNGGQVKLVVPNEQIKYLTLADTAGLTGDALRDEIRASLDGATPYAVDDLSFDWTTKDGTIFVAAVANETLDEAEAFAKSHHFQPVCFVATPEDGQFSGEAYFGPAASWSGDAPERDANAIVLVAAPLPPSRKTEPVTPVADASLADLVEDPAADMEEATSEVADEAQGDEDDGLSPHAAEDPEPDPKPERPPLAVQSADDVPPTPAFASIRASRNTPPPAASVAPAATAASVAPAATAASVAPAATAASVAATAPADNQDTPVKPRLQLGGARKSAHDTDVTAPVLQVETSEQPLERKGFGFFSRRKPNDAPKAKCEPTLALSAQSSTEEGTPEKAKHDPAAARAAVARIAAMRAAGRDTNVSATASVAATIPDERQRMTIFGARSEPQVGGKPRFLGLILTSALLIFLLAVAAWASVFLDEGLSRFFDRTDKAPSIARLPDVDLLPLDGSVTEPDSDVEDVRVAALDTGEMMTPDTGLSPVLPPPAALTPEEAAARYAATGIWQKSPDAPPAPALTSLDDLYVASIDSRVQQFDALALPSAEALRNDDVYLSHPNPALPGTKFQLDERGLVVATPEGTVNPDGVRVFAGLPPVVPPLRTPAAIASPETAAAVAPQNIALQAFRPRPRPGGLIEGNERAQLGGRTRAELAALRPNVRPETLKAVEEEAQPDATEYAVAQSVQPVTRPRNFTTVVERARATQQTEQARQPEVTQIATAAAVATVQPRIPSTANVAREATVTNAINLRKINLIGVYGKPSNRRALVRLTNGRYQKVQVGDRLDGGRVAAIGNSELQYTKNGRNVVLDMPDG
jgi:hypothetical protein